MSITRNGISNLLGTVPQNNNYIVISSEINNTKILSDSNELILRNYLRDINTYKIIEKNRWYYFMALLSGKEKDELNYYEPYQE